MMIMIYLHIRIFKLGDVPQEEEDVFDVCLKTMKMKRDAVSREVHGTEEHHAGLIKTRQERQLLRLSGHAPCAHF